MRIVGFWYIGLGEAIGVIDAWWKALGLKSCIGIAGCEEEDDGLE